MANDIYQMGAQLMNPNAARMGMNDMRMMNLANRMETPFERGSRGSYSRSGGGMPGDAMLGRMADEPDLSQFTYNPQMNAAARAAGVQPLEASQVKQNVLLPNTGFFGAHPRLSGAIEGGIFGGLAAHGGNTPGESIQGALEGIVGGQRVRQGLYRQQFARPFEASSILSGLEDQKQKRNLQAADIEHLRAVNEHLKNGDWDRVEQLTETNRHNEAVEAMRNNQLEATAPRNLGGGLYGYYNPKGTGPNQKGEWSIQENPEAKLGRQGTAQAGMLKGFEPPSKTHPNGRYVELPPGSDLPKGFQPFQESAAQKQENKTGDKREAFLSAKRKPSELLGMGYQGSMTDGVAQKKFLGDFWDKNIAPNVPESNKVPGGFHQNPDGSFSED